MAIGPTSGPIYLDRLLVGRQRKTEIDPSAAAEFHAALTDAAGVLEEFSPVLPGATDQGVLHAVLEKGKVRQKTVISTLIAPAGFGIPTMFGTQGGIHL